ncbi:MAG: EF-P 5-aminopentanol modification-associated protein YfmH [Bacillota bacterium]
MMKIKHYDAYQETMVSFKLHDRLDTLIIKKPGFSKTYVTITAPIGGINHSYQYQGKTINTEPGIAHFLEHKIFEQDGEDISRLFAKDEAQVNAFTEYDRTTYVFYATKTTHNHIKRLVDMFFYPVFTDEGVTKEKNIIQEELNMHLDDPYYQEYQTLLNQMFHTHPIKEDILGTKDSINNITAQALEAMHKAYYKPETARLIIIGDVDEQTIKTHLEDTITLPAHNDYAPQKTQFNEPPYVSKSKNTLYLDILMPSVLVGIKVMPNEQDDFQTQLKNQLIFSMGMSLLFGKSSDIYESLLNQNLVNDTYGIDINIETSYGYGLIGSETSQPDTLAKTLTTILETLYTYPLDHNDFIRAKKQMVGNFLMSLDNLEYLAHESSKYTNTEFNIYDLLTLAKTITYQDIINWQASIKKPMISTVIIKPKTD